MIYANFVSMVNVLQKRQGNVSGLRCLYENIQQILNLDYHYTNFISIIFFYWYSFIRVLVNAIASSYEPIIPEAIYNIIRKFYLAFGNFWDNEQKNAFLNCVGSANTRYITYAGASGGPSR